MLLHTTVQALGEVRLAELHEQARRETAIRTARRAGRQAARRRTPAVLATLTRTARRPRPAPQHP